MSQSEEIEASEELFNTEDPQLTEDVEEAMDEELISEEIENLEENEEELTEMTEEGSEQQAEKKKATQNRVTNLPIAKIKHIIK